MKKMILAYFLFLSNMMAAHVVSDALDISIPDTIQLESLVIVVSMLYLVIYFFFQKGLQYESQYKPPFTMFYVMVHVYGLGFFLIFCMYGLFGSSFQLALMLLFSLVYLFFDDILFNNKETPLLKLLLITNVVSAGCVCAIILLESSNYKGIAEMLVTKDWYSIIFAYVIPVLSPIIMTLFRTSHYCTRLHDAVLDIVKFALPFAVIIAVPSILNTTHSALFFDSIFQTRNKVVMLFVLPILSLMSIFYLFYSVLIYDTAEAIVVFSAALATRYLLIQGQNIVYGLELGMCVSFMILVRVFYVYKQYKHNTKNIIAQQFEYYDDESSMQEA